MEYLESVDNFTKWDAFYMACNFTQSRACDVSEVGGIAADISQVDIGRRALNFSSSPVKDSD
jgi:hypothetical protein